MCTVMAPENGYDLLLSPLSALLSTKNVRNDAEKVFAGGESSNESLKFSNDSSRTAER
jgi:hypothetical protein